MDGKLIEELLEERPEEVPDRPEGKPVLYYKTRTIRSGEMTEVEIYPVFAGEYRRQLEKTRPTTKAQKTVNDRNARKRFQRLAECNFTIGADYAMTLTYDGPAPEDDRQLNRDLRNYLARVNRLRARQGLPKAKCVGVIQRGDKNGRLHHHILISGGIDRDEMETMWGHGHCNCDRIRKELRALLKYMTRGFEGKRDTGRHRYFYTRNLDKRPKVTESRTKVSVRMAERIREDAQLNGEDVICRKYPGMALEEIKVYKTGWMPGAYIYAVLRRKP